ncbi:RICIN domain-containing protein [Deinococcus misasensis]|uniref:RICIN domain-containing protein n=1 Tax=Deinococcus misasensis TaxID=392413 RepID=UPI00068FC414|nr:RICIN domain-containing protein [Deinococcus misasensis]
MKKWTSVSGLMLLALTACSTSTPTPSQSITAMAHSGGGADIGDGKIFRLQAVHSGKCLDVAGISQSNDANIHQWDCVNNNPNYNQDFKLKRVNAGGVYYQLVPQHSQKCADVVGFSQENGGRVAQWDCHSNPDDPNLRNQLFALWTLGNDTYHLVAKHSDKCLDIAGISQNNGAQLTQWSCTQGDNQKFRLIPTSHSGGGDTPGPSKEYCDPFATIQVGPYKYVNNTWGSDKTNGRYWKQCLQERTVNGQKQYGWNWNWPGYEPTVYAYPEIIFGWKPWDTAQSTDARFPMKVDGMPNVILNYDVEGSRTGYYDFAPEIWLTRSGGAGNARPGDIATEIMVWLDYNSGANPAGSRVAGTTIDGVYYDIYKAYMTTNGAAWDYITYKGPAGRNQASLNFKKFIEDSVNRGYANRNHYLTGIEFGDESSGGTGNIWIKNFTVTVQ